MSNILRLPALDISTGQDPEGSQSRKRRLRFLATALLAIAMIAAGAFLILNRNASVAEIPRPAAAVTITDAVPRRQLWPVALETSGPIHPWQEASIGAQLGGYRLVEVLVNVGDAVRKGQVLARFDPDLLLAEEAQLKARFEQADANWQRSATLKVRGVVSDKELLYETEVKSAEASLTSKQLQLRYTEVTAPDDGTISFRTATLGTARSYSD